MTDREKSCAELVHGQWQKRREDLTNPEFEGLCFDYVDPNTFNDQPEGYWRWQFSWGGPGDELRAYVNRDDSIHRLEYWYLDWFDGAKLEIQASEPEWNKMQDIIFSTAPGQRGSIGMWEELSGPDPAEAAS